MKDRKQESSVMIRRKEVGKDLVGRGLALVKSAAVGCNDCSSPRELAFRTERDRMIPELTVTRRISGESEGQLHNAQRLENVGHLAATVGHDFNNLITVIIGHSEMLLLSLPLDNPMFSSLSEIRKAGQSAATLNKQLMLLSRKQTAEFSEVNLNTVISGIGNMLKLAVGKRVVLECVMNPSLGSVRADPLQIQQVLMNLVINARDAMPAGGNLLIETANVDVHDGEDELYHWVEPGAYVRLTVSDTGTGMTKEVMARIFEPYFTTKASGDGTGLGLSTVYGIVKRAGGSVRVCSNPGEGTVFSIYVPRSEPAMQ
jgi:two-component system cell cycle sensor histidine kinase/response regulator CckA